PPDLPRHRGRLIPLVGRAYPRLAGQLVHGGVVARRRALEPSQRRCGCVRHRLRSLLATNLDRAYLDDQPVVGGRDARRQTRRELRMRRRVGEVREEGPARTDLLRRRDGLDRKSTRLNSSHRTISYAVFCLKKKKKQK